jgi:hypothetical protein
MLGKGYLDPHRRTVPVLVGGHHNPVCTVEALEVLSPDAY